MAALSTIWVVETFGFWIPGDVYYIDSLPVSLEGTDVVLVVLSALLMWWLVRSRETVRTSQLGWLTLAAIIGVGLFAAWGVPANMATDGRFWELGINKHVVGRSLEAMEGHGGKGWQYFLTLPLYIPVAAFAIVMWSMFLPGAISAMLGGRLGGRFGRAMILSWVLPTFLLMSFVATKLPHYILPVLPALVLAVGGVICTSRMS